MSTRLIVDSESQLHEVRERELPRQPPAIRAAARLISWVFHPVFVPLYVTWFLLYVHPYLFAGFPPELKLRTMMMAVISFTFFPLVTVLLLKGLKFIDTIYLHTQKDRIIPFIACMVWYFWITYVWFNFGKTKDGVDMPAPAIEFAMASFLSTVIGLMINIKMKISLHAMAAGIVLTLFLQMALTQSLYFGIWISVVLLLTGLVSTARLIISDHTTAEVYGGLLAGAAAMLGAHQLVNLLG